MSVAPSFRRLVLELALAPVAPEAIRLAGEVARALDADLHGVFVEDEALLLVSGYAFSREFRLPVGEWRALETEGLEADMRHHADMLRARLREVSDSLGLRGGFAVRRGEPVDCLTGECAATDIVAVLAGGDALRSHGAELRAALGAAPPAMLLVPETAPPADGAVVAVADGPDDPALALAAAIARRRHARSVAAVPPGVPAGPCDERREIAAVDAAHVASVLGPRAEWAIVLGRGAGASVGADAAARLARERGAPVLML